MKKKRITILSVATVIMLTIVSSLFLLLRQPLESSATEPSPENLEMINLGITYLRVTPQVSDYYNLDVDSGALVTEVLEHSFADLAGIEVGDVIFGFNGIRLKDETTLLELLMGCQDDEKIELKVCRGKNSFEVDLIQIER